jgi:hypothetical protein
MFVFSQFFSRPTWSLLDGHFACHLQGISTIKETGEQCTPLLLVAGETGDMVS